MNEFTVIGVYQNIHQAYIYRDRLEIEGIEAWVTDENTVINNPFYASKVGGAKLQVKTEDSEKAKTFLKQLEQAGEN